MEIVPANKDIKEFKGKLKLIKTDSPSYVVMIISHKEYNKNDICKLSCRRMIPMDGYSTNKKIVPIGGYVYDFVSDTYSVNCIDYLSLGFLPFCFKMTMENVGQWSVFVPIPEKIIRDNLPDLQKSDLDKFKLLYNNKEEFNQEFIQFVGTS